MRSLESVMATNLELWMSCTCPIRKMGGHSSEHVEACPVHNYLAAEEASIEQSLSTIHAFFKDAPLISTAVLAYHFVMPAVVGLAVGLIADSLWGWGVFAALQISVWWLPGLFRRKDPQ